MITVTHLIFLDSKCLQPIQTELLPICMPFQICIRLTEEFHLHLLKFSGTEGEVTRCNLVSERFSNLADTKWKFLSGCTLYVLKVYKNTLRCLRTKIYYALSILCNSLKRLEHQIEFPDLCKIMFSAGRTWNIILFDICFHLLMAPAINTVSNIQSMFMGIIFNHLIRAETLVTFFTIHQRITESSQMSASNPCLWIHQNCTIHTYIIWRLLYKLLPPCSLYIVLQLNSKITVIPCVRKSAIDLRPRIYESS